ncbi:hypothetical protein GGS24DRAFT_136999 [Hypoxylon argillaceum]|nr:hypothetical protein GGS24DRAFT_136999 [Hypoxylon argillaceum]KAI1155688.1 hypothetical protein F4825DRAFT_8392 [Nemania diffusa]
MYSRSCGNVSQPGTSRSASQQPMSTFPLEMNPPTRLLPMQDSQFDILQWYPQFQSCVRFFLDRAQYEASVQAMAAFINIQLPFQKSQSPVTSSRPPGSPSTIPSPSITAAPAGNFSIPSQACLSISLTPYIRRLVATGFDFPGMLHGFFGDDWVSGIGNLHEEERRNYLFAAKASNWLHVKSQYDMPDGQTIPFLRPLQNAGEEEIVNAEKNWSQWLAMQDWMIGPRSPEDIPPIIKDEDV